MHAHTLFLTVVIVALIGTFIKFRPLIMRLRKLLNINRVKKFMIVVIDLSKTYIIKSERPTRYSPNGVEILSSNTVTVSIYDFSSDMLFDFFIGQQDQEILTIPDIVGSTQLFI